MAKGHEKLMKSDSTKFPQPRPRGLRLCAKPAGMQGVTLGITMHSKKGNVSRVKSSSASVRGARGRFLSGLELVSPSGSGDFSVRSQSRLTSLHPLIRSAPSSGVIAVNTAAGMDEGCQTKMQEGDQPAPTDLVRSLAKDLWPPGPPGPPISWASVRQFSHFSLGTASRSSHGLSLRWLTCESTTSTSDSPHSRR